MLYWALMFLVVALIAALFGFGGIAAEAAVIGKVLFVVFLILFLVSLLTGAVRRPVVYPPGFGSRDIRFSGVRRKS